MRIRYETKTEEVKVYVADDGMEFYTREECDIYEFNKGKKKFKELTDKLRIKELNGTIPLNDDGLPNDMNDFRWYKIKDKQDFDFLKRTYNCNFDEPSSYPDIICVEVDKCFPYDSCCNYNMTDINKTVSDFYKKLGYRVIFEGVDAANTAYLNEILKEISDEL